MSNSPRIRLITEDRIVNVALNVVLEQRNEKTGSFGLSHIVLFPRIKGNFHLHVLRISHHDEGKLRCIMCVAMLEDQAKYDN